MPKLIVINRIITIMVRKGLEHLKELMKIVRKESLMRSRIKKKSVVLVKRKKKIVIKRLLLRKKNHCLNA